MRRPSARARRSTTFLFGALCAFAWPARSAQARLRFAGESPEVYTLQPRAHLFAHSLQLGAGVLPLDAFYIGLAVHGSYTYHFSDLWAWEVVHAAYSFDFDTSLVSSLASFGAAAQVQQIDRVRLLLGSHAQITPLTGKIAVFNRAFVMAETHFLAGAGLIALQGQNGVAGGGATTLLAPAIDLGAGLDVFVSRSWAVRVDIRDAIAFGGAGVVNVMTVALAGSYNFGAMGSAKASQGKT